MSSGSKETKSRKWVGFSFAWNGLKEVIKTERNFRIHCVITLFVIAFSFFVGLSLMEWGVLVLAITFVLTMEMLNSAIERVMDFLSPEHHPLVGKIKDITAGAVFVAALASVIIGCILFIPKFL